MDNQAKDHTRPWTWFDLSEDYGHERVNEYRRKNYNATK